MSVRPILESRRASDEVIHAARIAEQGEEGLDRDSAMAENIEWLAERAGTGNIVVWGHNEHFGRLPYTLNNPNGTKSSGSMLAERYGAAYVPIATIALKGMFNAMEFTGLDGSSVIGQYPMAEATSDDYATYFASAAMPRMIVPLRGALPSWLALAHPIRIAGSNISTRSSPTVTLNEELSRRFDGVIYIELSTPTKLR